jgi:peptide/nickel transport system ATP-binding protein
VHFRTSRGLLRAVDGVSFDLRTGETLGIVGESGSGKSVLVRSIMKLLPTTSALVGGEIIFDGRDMRHLSGAADEHFWGTQMAMVFQDPMTSLNPVKRIGTQITESMRFHLDLSGRDATERALDLMNQVGISEPRKRLEQYPHELSGGMRQRVTIAIAVSCRPRLLFADEPTTALDVTVQKQILDLLARLQHEQYMAMILISHDLGVVADMTDRVAVMYAGQIVEMADTDALFSDVEHPYTHGLLQSTPSLDRPTHTRLEAIPGRPPDGVMAAAGCRFAPRCRYAQEACVLANPPLAPTADFEHTYRCWYPIGTTGGRNALVRNLELGRTAAGLDLAGEAMS